MFYHVFVGGNKDKTAVDAVGKENFSRTSQIYKVMFSIALQSMVKMALWIYACVFG